MKAQRTSATMLILVVMVGCEGGDGPTPTSSTGHIVVSTSPHTPTPDDKAQREAKVLEDANGLEGLLNSFWTNELRLRYNIVFDPPDRFEYYHGDGNKPCGNITTGRNNAYFCDMVTEEYIAFDLDWLAEYLRRYPEGATTFLILAHEWGHSVQDAWLDAGGDDTWNPAYRKELNADCLAGVFLEAALRTGTIKEDPGDANAIWTWLFENGAGTWFVPGDHGTSDQRRIAFSEGVAKGTAHCRTAY